MKRKIFSFAFAFILLLTGSIVLSACGNKDKNVALNIESKDYVSVYMLKDGTYYMSSHLKYGSDQKFYISLVDYYDIDSLKIYNNGSEISWTKNENLTPSESVSGTQIEVGHFTLTDIKSDVNLTFSCEEKLISFDVKVIDSSIGEDHVVSWGELTKDQQYILNSLRIFDNKTIGNMLYANTTATVTYSDIIDGIKITDTRNKFGDINNHFITNGNLDFIYDSENKNEYLLFFPFGVNFNNTIMIDVSYLNYSTWYFDNNSGDIVNISSADPTYNIGANENKSFVITIDAKNGVDISNAELYINGTKIDMVDNSYTINTAINTPLSYIDDFNQESASLYLGKYEIELKNVDFSTATNICKLVGGAYKSEYAYYHNNDETYYLYDPSEDYKKVSFEFEYEFYDRDLQDSNANTDKILKISIYNNDTKHTEEKTINIDKHKELFNLGNGNYYNIDNDYVENLGIYFSTSYADEFGGISGFSLSGDLPIINGTYTITIE